MSLSTEASGFSTDAVLADDPRWQVIERIVASPCFQRSERLKAFLKYVALEFLSGRTDRLSGSCIASAVFGRTIGHDQPDDNTVRIYARQLRLRLLEYFDTYGRDESILVEIPKGSYVPVFRPVAAAAEEIDTAVPPLVLTAKEQPLSPVKRSPSGWIVAGLLAVALMVSLAGRLHPASVPKDSAGDLWPLSELASASDETQIVLCDNSFALYQVAGNHRLSLSDYLKPDYPRNIMPVPDPTRSGVEELIDQLGRKQITAYADAATAARIARLPLPGRWITRPARDIKLRELSEGNYIFLGSAWANPWVELYQHKLNFLPTDRAPMGVVNRHPQTGESATYVAQGRTGNVGDDYASIAVIPNEKRGAVMIIQGTKEEGTEAAGMFISSPAGRKQLQDRLHIQRDSAVPVYFEVLLRTQTFAGAPAQTEIVAVHRTE